MKSAIERLKQARLRVTQPRLELFKVLAGADRPLSAEEIMGRVGRDKMDLVTVYRNTATFAEHGLVQVIQMEGGKQLFELFTSGDHHHHIICRECHATERIESCFGGELERLAESKGFSDLTHTIEVFGLCASCRA